MAQRSSVTWVRTRINRRSIFYAAGVVILIFSFTFRLSAITRQFANQLELVTYAKSIAWHAIFSNPINAPYYILTRLVHYVHHGLFFLRLPSVLWGLIGVALFFQIVKRLHGIRIALFASILFATNNWVLHLSRFAAPDVLLLIIPLGLIALFLRKKSTDTETALPILPVMAILLSMLYISGAVWFLLVACVVRFDVIALSIRAASKKQQLAAGLLSTALIAPLIYALIIHPLTTLQQLLAVSVHATSLSAIVNRFFEVPINVFVRGPEIPALWLGRLPVVEFTTAALALIGLAYYLQRRSHTWLFFGLAVTGWLVITFGGILNFTVIVPIVLIFASGGIAYMLKIWQRVFPRNPIARTSASLAIMVIIGLIAVYNLRQYFVGWAYNGDTRAVYQQKL